MTSCLKQLSEAGQAVRLNFVDRKFLGQGGLRKIIEEDGLTGVTSNPSIFARPPEKGPRRDRILARGDRRGSPE